MSQLKVGQAVAVTLDGREEKFEGEITGIDPRIDPASRLVSVRAAIENPDNVLTPGQFARIAVQMPKEDGVIILPQNAVVTSLYGDYVFVVRPMDQKDAQENREKTEEQGEAAEAAGQPQTEPAKERASQVFVQLGRRNGGDVEIRSGVEVGDRIITAGQNRLTNGAPIAIDNTINPGVTDGQEQASKQ